MLDEYSRQRLDRVAIDVAFTRNTVQAIKDNFSSVKEQFENQESRLIRVERRVFALWIIGPIAIAGTSFLKTFKTWFMEN
ncbi:MAG: hypothetical protein O7E56_02960 [SAR324 cluster bacterium]|nr:hypothetical protein [SAR324 cluster bacterium]